MEVIQYNSKSDPNDSEWCCGKIYNGWWIKMSVKYARTYTILMTI